MKLFTRYLHRLCAVYTVAVLLLLLLNVALGSSLNATTVNAAAFLWLFVFSALFSAANLQLTMLTYSYPLRVLFHCVITVGSAFGLLYLPNNAASAASGKLMMLLLMLVLYWVIMAIYLILHGKYQRVVNARNAAAQKQAESAKTATMQNKKGKKEQTPYKSLFGNKEEGAD